MKEKSYYNLGQLSILVILRIVIGYHFLYEGVDKLFSSHWSSAGFLLQSNWLFSDFFHYIANSPDLLSIVNFMNIWGQIFIGIGLIAGLFSTVAALFGAFLILSYYVAIPPFLNTFTFIDKNLFEFFGFLIIVMFPTSKILGLDSLLEKYRGKGNE